MRHLSCFACVVVFLMSAANAAVVYEQGFEGPLEGAFLDEVSVVRDASVSHSGDACVSSTKLVKNDGNRLYLPVTLEQGALYHIEMWLKSDARCGIGFGTMDTWPNRKDVGRFYPIPAEWTHYEMLLAPEPDATKSLYLYLPHTFLAAPGTVWVDDIRISLVGRYDANPVQGTDGYAEDAAMARTGNDRAMLVWLDSVTETKALDEAEQARTAQGVLGLEVTGQHDRILASAYADGSWSVSETLAEGWIFDPAVASAGDGESCAAWSERQADGAWRIVCRVGRAGAWGPAVTVSDTGGNQCQPAIAPASGGYWVAWTSHDQGQWRIHAALVSAGSATAPVLLSESVGGAYRPTAAGTGEGGAWVAWQEFDGTDYRIAGRRLSDSGPVSEPLVMLDSEADEGHPALVADPVRDDVVWLACDVGTIPIGGVPKWGRSATQRMNMRSVVARIEGGEAQVWELPYAAPTLPHGERPSLAVAEDGTVWVLERTLSPERGHWILSARHSRAGGWSDPEIISGGRGGSWLPAAVAVLEGGPLAVWQMDERKGDRHMHPAADPTSWLVSRQPAPEGAPPALSDAQPLEAPAPGSPAGRETRPAITVNGERLNQYWGELHCHSRYSLCARNRDLDPFDTYVYTRDYEDVDFIALTDHGCHMNRVDWFNTAKLASLHDAPGYFTAFLAQEWSSAKAYIDCGRGHKNIIYRGRAGRHWFNPHLGMQPDQLFEELDALDLAAFAMPHQIADGSGGAWTEWQYYDPRWEPLAEVFQIRGSYEYLGAPWQAPQAQNTPGAFYQDALNAGRQVGAMASSDHGGGHGKVAVYAEALGRGPVFDALKARRTFGTSNARFFLGFRVNGAIMGSTVDGGAGPREIVLEASASQPLAEVVVFKNGRKIFEEKAPGSRNFEREFSDSGAEKPVDWYYLRAIQEDGHIAWSSPVWVGR